MKNFISIILFALLLTSCEKIVDLKYKDNQSRLIIEGNITNGPGPYFIKISKSVSLTETGNYPTIDNALVKISDDAGNSEILIAQGDGLYKSMTLVGIAGRTYILTVQVENQTYTAQSTMPQQVTLDSIKVEQITSAGGEKEYNLIPQYFDPSTKGNNYRFVLSVNGKLINQHFIQNDEIKNGAINTFQLEVEDDDLELKAGDSIAITMQCIDTHAALYYSTLALMATSGPGGGTTPTNPQNNLSNGALGLFSAHTNEVKATVIP